MDEDIDNILVIISGDCGDADYDHTTLLLSGNEAKNALKFFKSHKNEIINKTYDELEELYVDWICEIEDYADVFPIRIKCGEIMHTITDIKIFNEDGRVL